MSGDAALLYGLCGAGLVGYGLYAVAMQAQALRRILGFNLMGAGIFLLYGAAARRGAAAGFAGDPVPHALIITGVVVAFSATALAVALVLRIADAAREEQAKGDGP
jgi:multicomponent Na+:H+ antiporter subunit C